MNSPIPNLFVFVLLLESKVGETDMHALPEWLTTSQRELGRLNKLFYIFMCIYRELVKATRPFLGPRGERHRRGVSWNAVSKQFFELSVLGRGVNAYYMRSWPLRFSSWFFFFVSGLVFGMGKFVFRWNWPLIHRICGSLTWERSSWLVHRSATHHNLFGHLMSMKGTYSGGK